MPYIGEKLSAAGKVQNMEGVELQLDADGDTGITADTDDQVDIKIGGTDRVKIESDGDTTITSTTNDANAGPIFSLVRNRGSASCQDNDLIGELKFTGQPNALALHDFASIQAKMLDISNGTEDAELNISILMAGTEGKSVLKFSPTEAAFNDDSEDVDFRVESNGNTHALFVDAGNDHVNIGTSTDHGGVLNVESTDNTDTLVLVSTDADENEGPILKLDRNSSSPANSDKTGFVSFTARNAADESTEISNIETRITDITDGAEDSRLILRTIANGTLNSRMDINSTETVFNEGANDINFRIESDTVSNMFNVDAGNNSVRIGNNNNPESATTRCIINGSSTNRPLDIDRSTTTASADVVKVFTNVGGTNTNVATIEANGDFLSATNSYGSLSDERFKQDIVDSGSQWDDVKAMRIRKYRRKNMVATEGDNAPVEIGVIAQELESSDMGGLVKTNPKDDENKEEFKTVKYTVLYMKAVKALQEAMARIETLEAKVAKLEG
jgi:hypothetical protein